MTDRMHTSSSSLRPRQRTFTSCTECRRRKQRCNQAKDRPCNNCARRYPPVVCTYAADHTSSPPSIDRAIDLRDNLAAQPVLGSSVGSHPSYYMPTSQSDISCGPPTTTSYYTVPTTASYSPTPTSRSSDYNLYQSDTSRYQYSTASSAPTYAVVDAGYYHNTPIDYCAAGTQNGYYATADQHQGAGWYTTNGDPGVFVGATSAEYYYVEPDPDDLPSSTRS